MRKLIAFVLMMSLLSCSLYGTKSQGSNPRPDGPVRIYEYSYNNTAMYPEKYYAAERDSTGAVCISWSSDNQPEIRVIHGPDDFFDRIGAMVEQYKLHRLKGVYTPRMLVLDGNSWSFYIRFTGNSISAHGSNAWPPEKLVAGMTAINDYIRSLIAAAGEDDIVARRSHDDR